MSPSPRKAAGRARRVRRQERCWPRTRRLGKVLAVNESAARKFKERGGPLVVRSWGKKKGKKQQLFKQKQNKREKNHPKKKHNKTKNKKKKKRSTVRQDRVDRSNRPAGKSLLVEVPGRVVRSVKKSAQTQKKNREKRK